MNKIIVFFFFLIYFFFLNIKITFSSEYFRYQFNPIIPQQNNNWPSSEARSPALIYENGVLKMWFTEPLNNHWGVSYIQSTNGINWDRTINQHVLEPSNDNLQETHILEPTVLKTDKYYMWYNSTLYDNAGIHYNIRLATSQDGINWNKINNYVLTPELDWEKKGVNNPSVIYKDNEFLMFYSGWGNDSIWRIGLATSTDGINWVKNKNNPLNIVPNIQHVGNHVIQYKDNSYILTYVTGDGINEEINQIFSTNLIDWHCQEINNCTILKKNNLGFESQSINDLDIIEFNNNKYLYYTGLNNNLWQIGVATEKPLDQPSQKIPLVIIPGLFASWNKQALVYNQAVNQSDWQMNPFAHEYEGIIQTLKNVGYEENKDYFVFNYDWRKGLNSLADDLKVYLENIVFTHQTAPKVNLIGHSLGGMVARTYAQKYGVDKINKIITVGSPHQGVAQVYKTVEAGEIDRFNNYLWLASKFLIQLYRDGLKTDKQIINEKIPVLKDLFPTYNFLKDTSLQEISVNNMKIKNDTLNFYNSTSANFYAVINAFVGETGNTLFGYKIGPQTTLDNLLNLYPDGRPLENFEKIGDYTVLSSSARFGENNKIFPLEHGQLIYKKETIKEIFSTLGIPYQEEQISEGHGTIITPSLFFLVLSPATMKVLINNNTYIENEGLIFIENAQAGNYQLELTGKENGKYQVLVGQVGENADQWTKIYGEINSTNPSSQKDTYQIKFDEINPKESDPDIDQLIIQIIDTKAKKYLQEAKKAYLKKKYLQVKINLEKALQIVCKLKLIDSISDIENLYSFYLKDSKLPILDKKIKAKISLLKQAIPFQEKFLVWQKKFGKDVTEKALLLKIIEEKIDKADKNFKDKNYYYAEILLKSVEYLIKEIK